MKQHFIWILALAAMTFSSQAHAQHQQSWPDSLMFEGINLNKTSYNEIVEALGEPDQYVHSPGMESPNERFWYFFPGPDELLGEGEVYIQIAYGQF